MSLVGFGWWVRGDSVSSQRLQYELKLGRGWALLSKLLDQPGPVLIAVFGAKFIETTSTCLFKTLNPVACRCCFLLINLGTQCRSLVQTVVFYVLICFFLYIADIYDSKSIPNHVCLSQVSARCPPSAIPAPLVQPPPVPKLTLHVRLAGLPTAMNTS